MSLQIIKAGLFDTVQDTGRYGHQHLGINPGGAMDRFSALLANALLGKEFSDPVVELHFPAAQLLFQKACVLCLTGADFSPTANDQSLPLGQPVLVQRGTLLRFAQPKRGARCYLALLNKLKVDRWLGSYATNTKAAAGGFCGRRLQANDELNFEALALPQSASPFERLPWRYKGAGDEDKPVDFIPGNEWHWLSAKSQIEFVNTSFVVTQTADRMGYRLQGEALVQKTKEQLISSAVNFGTVQLLPNGQPLVLMADHQTTGGYPRIGHVISAHLPRLAQKRPGESIRFAATTVEDAEEKLMTQVDVLKRLQSTCKQKIKTWLYAH